MTNENHSPQVDPAATRLSIQTDQSALMGLMRHLHVLGFVFAHEPPGNG
jgi:hypothetical protein